VGTRLCALPVEHVVEIMRPLPIEPMAGMAHFVMGLAVVRGLPIPVVDAAMLLGAANAGRAGRFVTLHVDGRRTALSVEEVLGVRELSTASLRELPPLLGDASAEIVSAIGTLDAELLVVLRAARILTEPVRTAIDTSGSVQ
jgi:purine-binding chemotaxis protein CheW